MCVYRTPGSTLEIPGSPLDPDHHMPKDTGNSFALAVELFNDKDSFSFLMWVMWEPSDDFFFKKLTR